VPNVQCSGNNFKAAIVKNYVCYTNILMLDTLLIMNILITYRYHLFTQVTQQVPLKKQSLNVDKKEVDYISQEFMVDLIQFRRPKQTTLLGYINGLMPHWFPMLALVLKYFILVVLHTFTIEMVQR
jgi:hypothetical protein